MDPVSRWPAAIAPIPRLRRLITWRQACCMPHRPRRPRLQLPGNPLHATQRGVDRCAISVDELDRHHFCELRGEATAEHQVGEHAQVFMGHPVHLLLTPPNREASLD